MKVGGCRPKRQLSLDYAPATEPMHDLGDPVMEPIWLEPYPESMLAWTGGTTDPAARYEARESVELAFVAALQHLPATQRAVLILREVLAFRADEVASLLDMTVTSVNSALQRARSNLDRRVDGPSQRATLRVLGESGRRELVDAFVTAWERADVSALLGLLVEDARLSMPPLPAWFDGASNIGRFMSERMFATPWRLLPTGTNGQLAFGCYQAMGDQSKYRLSAINVLTLRGSRIAEITAFLDPAGHDPFGLPMQLAS
jgi:RNA polymerase sigma-70 factor (TIGR02960 family)